MKVFDHPNIVKFYEVYEDKKFITLTSITGRLSPKMLQYLSSLKPGSLLYFKDFEYSTSDGAIKTEPVFRAFLIEDDFTPASIGL